MKFLVPRSGERRMSAAITNIAGVRDRRPGCDDRHRDPRRGGAVARLRRQEDRGRGHEPARRVVTSHLRFGERVRSPQIAPGEADLLVGFEAAEALRWAHMLRPGASVLANTGRIVPPIVNGGRFDYPDDPIAAIAALGRTVYAIDASTIARELGEIRLGNTVMLGAVVDHLPLPADVLEAAVLERFARRKPHLLDLNREAFTRGVGRARGQAPPDTAGGGARGGESTRDGRGMIPYCE